MICRTIAEPVGPVSLRVISRQNGTPLPPFDAAEIERVARERLAQSDEIHFHTFSCTAYRELLTQVVPALLPDLHLAELHECGGYEVVAVLVKRAIAGGCVGMIEMKKQRTVDR